MTQTPTNQPPRRATAMPSLWQRVRNGDFELLTNGELLRVGLIAALALAAILWWVFRVVEPPPPRRLTITTGAKTGAYFSYAQDYAKAFKAHGITLEVVESKGSVDNLARLSDSAQTGAQAAARVDIGLVQSGVDTVQSHEQLESLASIAYEPIWVFYKPKDGSQKMGSTAEGQLTALRGKRVAIGPEGSGSRFAALKLFELNSLSTADVNASALGGAEAVEALTKGALDAAVLVAAADAPSVKAALAAGLLPMSFNQAGAYVRLVPWLSHVVLPRGALNLAQDLPRQDIQLLATSANLVVRKDLHPALAFLLMDIAAERHRAPSILNALGEFPSEKALTFAQSPESKRYFKSGRPFLQRYLPFWLANILERLAVTLLPALAVILPLVQLLPKFFSWRHRSHYAQLYHEVELLDARGELHPAKRTSALAYLDAIEAKLLQRTPSADQLVAVYNLRAHLDMMRARVMGPAA